jgi:crossover junction endodeoxyribonuclease RuvC
MVRIIGIDPGTRITGWGIIEAKSPNQFAFVDCGCIVLDAEQPISARLLAIEVKLLSLINEYHPDIMSVEDTFYHKDAKAALKIGQARGIALLVAAKSKMDVFEYPPATIKKAVTGNGNADKDFVSRMICMILKLNEEPQTDAADALAVALTHAIRS